MIVISDTSPLHYLVLIGYGRVLSALLGRVIVPHVVADELRQPTTPPDLPCSFDPIKCYAVIHPQGVSS
jgi:predicted nucleic acid-binding protein